MPYSVGLSIEGLQKAQRRNLRRIALLEPDAAPGRAVHNATAAMHRFLTSHTPWETGALRASRRISFNPRVPLGQVFNSANSYNPRSRTPPHVYDVTLHARGERKGRRGGILASYPYTKRVHSRGVLKSAVSEIHIELKGVK